MPLGHGQFGFGERRKIGLALRERHYDWAIVLPNSWKSALIPYYAKIPRRTGFIGECRWGLLNDCRKLDKTVLTKTVERFVALGLDRSAIQPPDCPFPKLKIEAKKLSEVTRKYQVSDQKKVLGLCPGAEYGPAKRWPSEYYAEIANDVLAEGWQVWLFGSVKDCAVAEQVNRSVGGKCLDLTGKTNIADAVDLMSLTDCVVTNDSGLMHVAAALGKKLVAIYGSSDPAFTPPLSRDARIISLGIDCSPCFKRECRYGHYRCLNDLKPAKVRQTLSQLCGF